ncbi:diguanylate cyclase [Guyparkeria halopsychrophila]|uniref:GGDEF domain-containing protein n=1 Tax=Guyparkeria halopsychrophila TaxID=3139421 RepID=UPI0037C806E0
MNTSQPHGLLNTLLARLPHSSQGAFRHHQREAERRIAVVAAIAALTILPAAQAMEQMLLPGYQSAELHNALWRVPVMVVSLAILGLRWFRPEGAWPRPLLQLFSLALLTMAVGIFARGQALESTADLYTGQHLIINIAVVSITATRGLRDLPLVFGPPLLFALPLLLLLNGVPLAEMTPPLIYPAIMVVVAGIIAELFYCGNAANFLAAQRLRQSAMTDPLTRLLNRRAMDAELTIARARAIRHEQTYALMMADLDHFKRVNDAYGHKVGDEVLVELALRLERSVRTEDRVARWGGEEFLLLVQGVDEMGAMTIAEKIRRAVAQTPFVTSAGVLEITISVGLAIHNEATPTEDLVAQADHALYQAKENGRNRVEAA